MGDPGWCRVITWCLSEVGMMWIGKLRGLENLDNDL